MCAAADAPSAKTPGVGTKIYSFGVGAEADRPDGCEAVREAIEQGATTWREVSAMTGISHEWGLDSSALGSGSSLPNQWSQTGHSARRP